MTQLIERSHLSSLRVVRSGLKNGRVIVAVQMEVHGDGGRYLSLLHKLRINLLKTTFN